MRIAQINLSEYADLPNPGLTNYLDHLERGQPDIYRTPYWGKAPMNQVVDEWTHLLLSNKRLDSMPGLREIELQQQKKVGPFSVIPPSKERMESVKSFWTLPKLGEPIRPSAIAAVKGLFTAGSLSLWSLERVVRKMRLNTNSGLPRFIRRRRAWDAYGKDIQEGKPYMAVWGTRVQPGGPSVADEKVRDVMMMPMDLNMKESQYYYPLLEYEIANKLPFSAGVTLRQTEVAVTQLFATKGDALVVNTDFSKFDQHFNKRMQEAALQVLLYAFARDAHDAIESTYWVKYNIPLLISKSKAIFGPHGMGSGATGTNPDENLAHKALQYEAAQEAKSKLNPKSLCLGDDGILSYPGISVEQVVSSYTRHGLDMNVSKQYADKHSTYYLQRYYHDSYRDKEGIMLGVYSTERALGRLLAQERFHNPETWGAKDVTYRALSIIENCNNHPCFESFVDFVKKGDKYQLGLLLPGFFDNLEKGWEEYKANYDTLSYTQQNETTSINDWRVIKYLKSGS